MTPIVSELTGIRKKQDAVFGTGFEAGFGLQRKKISLRATLFQKRSFLERRLVAPGNDDLLCIVGMPITCEAPKIITTMNKTHGEFGDILAITKPELRPVCESLRHLITSLHGSFVEVVWPNHGSPALELAPRR